MTKKYIHRAKTLPEIPRDYFERWDASTNHRMHFVTDEATGDVDQWRGQVRGSRFVDLGSGAYPVWTPGKITFSQSGRSFNQPANEMSALAADGVAHTTFCVCQMDSTVTTNDYTAFVLPNLYVRWSYDSGTTDMHWFMSPVQVNPTNNQMDKLNVMSGRVLRNTATDYDWQVFIGDTKLSDRTADNILENTLGIAIGGSVGANFEMDGVVHEVIVYDRWLSDVEHAAVVDYLSNKWGANASDTSTTDIVSASTTEGVWQSTDRFDTAQGEGLLTHPGGQDNEHSLTIIDDGLGVFDFPRTFGTNLKHWFDASDTSGMTFATGSASAGGTISAWVDRTGAVTMDTTTSGNSAVNFAPNGFNTARPCVYGNGSTMGLLSANITGLSTTTGDQRLAWAVVRGGGDSSSTLHAICNPHTYLHAGEHLWYAGDIEAGKNVIGHGAYADTGETYLPACVQGSEERLYVLIWRITQNASGTAEVCERWLEGMKLPSVEANTVFGGTTAKASVGQAATGSSFSTGETYEMGLADGRVFTDGEVDDLCRYLCNKYDVPYMSDTTPADISLHARSTSGTAARIDLFRWFRSDIAMSEDGWSMHPIIERQHTATLDYTAEIFYTDGGTVENHLGRKAHISDASANTGSGTILLGAGYNFAETTDFPADDGGFSCGAVVYCDFTNTPTSGRYFSHGGTSVMMSWNSGGTYGASTYVGGRVVQQGGGIENDWNFMLGRQAFDDDGTGTPDGDPHTWTHKNRTVTDDDNSTITSLGTIKVAVGGEVSPGNPGDAKNAELWMWKHVLSDEAVANMHKYVAHRYPTLLGVQTHPLIYPHREDADTIAHWVFDGDATDHTGNKGAFNTGTYSEAALPLGGKCHEHTTATAGFSYTAQDADLDTLGAFTFACAVRRDDATEHTIARSEPPAGGATSADNHRITFRINSSSQVEYLHQYGTKTNELRSMTATMPTDYTEWHYIAVTRSADGTTVRLMMDDTVEEFTGLTAPSDGANCRFELFEKWDGTDFDGDVYTCIFKDVESSESDLRAMKAQVFRNA